MLDVNDLRIVKAVTECLSFSKAAEKLYMTQPAVSKRIHMIEESYQIKLFDRNYHNLQLTNSGKIFYRYAKEMLLLHGKLITSLNNNELSKSPVRKIKVGLFITNGTKSIIRKFSEFAQEHPNIQIEFSNMMSDEVIENVINKKLDIGIAILKPNPQIKWKKLFSDEFVIVRDRNREQTNKLKKLSNKTLLAMPPENEDPLSKKLVKHQKHEILKNIDEIVTNLLVQDSYTILSKDVIRNLNNPELNYTEIKDYPRKAYEFSTGLVYRIDNASPIVSSLLRAFYS